jgi:5'-nucleotidase
VKASAISQFYGTGRPITLTARVALDSKQAAAGRVKFLDGTTLLATVPVVGGTATLSLSRTTSVGRHRVTAQFVPSVPSTTAGSTSAAVVVTVVNATSTTSLRANRTTQAAGKSVTFTATVKLNTGNRAVGSVRFTVDGRVARTVTVTGGVAKFSYLAKVGRHTVRGVYLPRSVVTVTGSTSNAVVVTVTR